MEDDAQSSIVDHYSRIHRVKSLDVTATVSLTPPKQEA
jgi:hypothetical protein